MPCFRLGAFGTERERHKRVTGLFSCVFADPAEGNLLAFGRPRFGGGHAGADPHRGPGPLRRDLALWLVRPLLPAPGLVPDPVAAIDELTEPAVRTPGLTVATTRSPHYDVEGKFNIRLEHGEISGDEARLPCYESWGDERPPVMGRAGARFCEPAGCRCSAR